MDFQNNTDIVLDEYSFVELLEGEKETSKSFLEQYADINATVIYRFRDNTGTMIYEYEFTADNINEPIVTDLN